MVSVIYNRTFKNLQRSKSAFARDEGEEIPLKKDRNKWERGALMVHIIVKGKNIKKILIVYFHLRFSIT